MWNILAKVSVFAYVFLAGIVASVYIEPGVVPDHSGKKYEYMRLMEKAMRPTVFAAEARWTRDPYYQHRETREGLEPLSPREILPSPVPTTLDMEHLYPLVVASPFIELDHSPRLGTASDEPADDVEYVTAALGENSPLQPLFTAWMYSLLRFEAVDGVE